MTNQYSTDNTTGVCMAPGAADIIAKAAACKAATGCNYVVWERPQHGRLAAFGGHDTASGSLGSSVAVGEGGNKLTQTHGAMCLADFDCAARAPGLQAKAPAVEAGQDPVNKQVAGLDTPSFDLG